MSWPLSRRQLLATTAGGAASLAASPLLGAAEPDRRRLGVCIHSYMIRPNVEQQRGGAKFADPINFLRHCRKLGAAGVQVGIGAGDGEYLARLRREAEAAGMYVEGIAAVPRDAADVPRFEAEVRSARSAGASVIRTVIIPGRRYERFKTLAEFREFARRGERSLELAEPVAARHRVRLAVENHKDQRVSERIALLKRIDSRYVGICVDTGNSFSLLEDPTEVVEAFAPWAYSVHLKDTAVAEHKDGFLLADVTLGEGFLDLPKIVGILRKTRPDLQFSLEAHTRDPLLVPCLGEKYWATFPDVPATELARALRTVRRHAAQTPLTRVSTFPVDQQIAREEENVRACLAYAHKRLGL